jgi:lysophospholipase L1-like esterase
MVAEELVLQVKADLAKATGDIKRLQTQIENTKKSSTGMTSAIKGGAMAFLQMAAVPLSAAAAIGTVAKVASDSVKAFQQAEDAAASLKAALMATGTAGTVSIPSLSNFAAELQRTTKFEDDATISAIAMLQSFAKLDEDGIKKVTPAVMDFATAMHMDLNSAMQLVAKTLSSETNALARYGIQVDMSKSQAGKLADVMEQLESKFKGAAEAAANTSSGAFAQLNNAIGDMQELGGQALAEFAQPFVVWLTDVISKSNAAATELNNLKSTLARGGGATTPVVGDSEQTRKAIDTEKKLIEERKRALAEQQAFLKGMGNTLGENDETKRIRNQITAHEDRLKLLQDRLHLETLTTNNVKEQTELTKKAAEAAAKVDSFLLGYTPPDYGPKDNPEERARMAQEEKDHFENIFSLFASHKEKEWQLNRNINDMMAEDNAKMLEETKRQYEELAAGMVSLFTDLGRAMADQENAAESLRDVAIKAISDTLAMLAKEMAVRAVAAAVAGNLVQAAGYAGAAALAGTASGFVAGSIGGGGSGGSSARGGNTVTIVQNINGSVVAQREVEYLAVNAVSRAMRRY